MALELESDWPRLSETLCHPHPDECNNCADRPTEHALQVWQEHDRHDKPEQRFVMLCKKCSDKLIEPHERLYAEVNANAPRPGAMLICTFCYQRQRLGCKLTKANGGPGITITACKPTRAFVDGTKFRGLVELYATKPTACSGQTLKRPAP